MRLIDLKYGGQCAKCGADLETGKQAMYEKSMGIFCPGCEPKDTEEIRHFRTLKAEAKADRLDGWAEKREQKAEADLNSFPTIRHDWAFITQPGRIPFRERMNRADDRAIESLDVAKGMRERASNIRKVRVAGDAEKARQKVREAMDERIKKGDRVYDVVFGEGKVLSVHKVSYRIQFDSKAGPGKFFTCARDKSYVRPL
jgi:hypothetical protein